MSGSSNDAGTRARRSPALNAFLRDAAAKLGFDADTAFALAEHTWDCTCGTCLRFAAMAEPEDREAPLFGKLEREYGIPREAANWLEQATACTHPTAIPAAMAAWDAAEADGAGWGVCWHAAQAAAMDAGLNGAVATTAAYRVDYLRRQRTA